jgi:hypothetical protein
MTGTGDNMETIIKINIKNGKFSKSVSEVISELALKLSYFIKENKLKDHKIEYMGRAKNKKAIEVKYRFSESGIIPFKLKVGRNKNEEIKNKKTRKRDKAA